MSKAKKRSREKNTDQGGKKKLEPLGNKVLVEYAEADKEEKTKGGIILPRGSGEDKATKEGKVVAVGEGQYEDGKLVPPKVKKGDTVLFQWADDVEFEGNKYAVVSESSILAVIK